MGSDPSKPSLGRDISQITEFLFLGNVQAATCPKLLMDLEIKNIVQLFETQIRPELENRVKHLQIPIRGGKNTNIRPVLRRGLFFIHSAVTQSQNVLVHCKHGKNRSASIVVAYIMATKDLEFAEAERFVKEIRPIVKLKPQTKEFLESLGSEGVKKLFL